MYKKIKNGLNSINERTIRVLAVISYIIIISIHFDIAKKYSFLSSFVLGIAIIFTSWKYFSTNKKKVDKEEIKRILIELRNFIPILILNFFIKNFCIVGLPLNEKRIINTFLRAPVYLFVEAVILSPILEEMIFRFLPSIFLKNKIIYVVLTSIIFAGIHVIKDPNPVYYILFYILISFYLGYRYYKTKDILVTISLHSFNNLICIIEYIVRYYM